MVYYLVLIPATLLVVHGAVLKNEDVTLRRSERSPCSTCRSPGPIPLFPPPRPPRFYTQNWNGVARSPDGANQGVFTGAAAGAAGDAQATGEAFSIASSSVGVSDDHIHGSNHAANNFKNDDGASKASTYNHGSGFGKNLNGGYIQGNQKPTQNDFENKNQQQDQQQRSHDFGASNGQNSYGSYETNQGHNNVGNGFAYESAASSFSKNEPNQNSNERYIQGNQQKLQNDFDNKNQQEGQQQQSNNFGFSDAENHASHQANKENTQVGNGFEYGTVSSNGKDNQLQYYHQSKAGADSFANSAAKSQPQPEPSAGKEHQLQHRGYGSDVQASRSVSQNQGGFNDNGQFSTGNVNGYERNLQEGSIKGSGTGERLQSTFRGALDLASQGLQASQQTACATCGKSSYALSNAKSKSGNAIAVSIGG